MADEGQTNFLRSILLLIEGGSYISRAIINRESTKTGRDINSLLGDFKTKLEHEFHGKQYQKLFPDTGEKTDINRWDLQLLIGVICIVFRKSISRSEKKDLLVIKQLRNDVFMHGAYASLDEEEYEEVIEQLEDSLNGLASTFEESVQEVCFTFIKNFKSGPLDALRPSIAALNGLSQTTQRKFTVGVSTELAVDGPSKYWTELCEDILETILNAAISRNESDGLENIRTKVTKMLEYLLANVDIVFQGCMRACIILKFECNSYEDMLYLLNKLDSWEHRYHLNKISNALTKEHKLNGLLNITSRVTTECLQSILIQRIKMLHEEEMGDDCLEVTSHTNYENKDEDKETYPKQDSDGIVSLTEDVRKPLKLGLECKSKEGLMHMLNLFKGNELQVHLKDVADALSEHVRKKVTLKTSLNIEDFMSAFEEAVIAERYEDRQLMTFVSRPDDISEDTQQQSESPIMEETFVPTKQEKLEADMKVRQMRLSWWYIVGCEYLQSVKRMSDEDTNDALLDEIIELLDSPDLVSPEVILLVGSSGAGKSSLINTLHGVITGRYYAIANQGGGETQSVTLDLLRYEHCGVKLHRIVDRNRREKMSTVFSKLPHILDCAGLGNVDTPELREIIELLVGGYLRPGICIDAVVQKQKELGTGNLKQYFKPAQAWKVSKIVFLQGCIDDVPNNMINCLKEVLKIYDPIKLTRKYPCKIFILLTKFDLVKDEQSTDYLDDTNSENLITNEHFQEKETSILKSFCSVGSLKCNSIRWVNATDSVEFSESNIPTKALEFLKKMVEPGIPRMPEPTIREKLEECLYPIYHRSREVALLYISQNIPLSLIVFFSFLCFGFYWLLNQTAETKQK